MISIQTNSSAGLIARQLSSTKRQFNTNLERLSTGLRLNRPDDSPESADPSAESRNK